MSKSNVIAIRIDDTEYKDIVKAAKLMGQKPSAFIRDAAMRRATCVERNKGSIEQLRDVL